MNKRLLQEGFKKILKTITIFLESAMCLLNIVLFNVLSINANEVLLFKNYEDKLLAESQLKEYLVSEKLDGIRAIWDGKVLKTRKGGIIHAPTCWIESFPDFRLDGELWTKHNDFENISSIVRQHKPTCQSWSEITYHVFDVIPQKDFDKELCQIPHRLLNECTLLGRLEKLRNYLKAYPNSHISIIPQEVIESKKALYAKLDSITKLQGEGLIIRKNQGVYQSGRNNENLKLKMLQDSECTIIGYKEGKGKLRGKMGAAICTQTRASLRQYTFNNEHYIVSKRDSKEKQNITFKIGSGWSNAMRENPPRIGSIITYKYQGLTKNDIPRFPTFLRIYKD